MKRLGLEAIYPKPLVILRLTEMCENSNDPAPYGRVCTGIADTIPQIRDFRARNCSF